MVELRLVLTERSFRLDNVFAFFPFKHDSVMSNPLQETATPNAESHQTAGYPETADVETSSDDYATRFRGAVGAWMLRVQEKAVLSLLATSVPPGARILDVGGGHGQLARPLAEAGYRVTVLGSAPSCRHRISDLVENGSVEFFVGNVIDLPFPSKSFDAVVAVRMLTHCTAWQKLVSEMCRVSAGPVITDYPTSQSLNAIAPALFKAKKRFEKNTRTWKLFRHTEVRKAFADCGFAPAGRIGQFFLPMVLHRMLKCKHLSSAAESVCRALGLSHAFGTPVVGRWKRLAIFLTATLALGGCTSSSGRFNTGSTVPILSSGQKAWFALPVEERKKAFSSEETRIALKALGDKPASISIRCNGLFSGFNGDGQSFTIRNPEAGKRYEFPAFVEAAGVSGVAAGGISFETENTPPRLLDLPGIHNARDFGGWRTSGGARVKQGLAIRSASFNDNASPRDNPTIPGASRVGPETRRVLVDELGIKTDIDLRPDREVFGMNGSPLGSGVVWIHRQFGMYDQIESDENKEAFAAIFKVLADSSRLPAAIHCADGQDRTGTLCFILGALLGVSEDDLLRDWEATALYNPSVAFRHEKRIDKLLETLYSHPGKNLREKAESYAISCGVGETEIQSWRSLMLEPQGE